MEENNENVVEETTQETVQTVDETKFDSADDDSVIKVDLNNPPKTKEDAVPEQSTDEVPVRDESEASEGVQQEILLGLFVVAPFTGSDVCLHSLGSGPTSFIDTIEIRSLGGCGQGENKRNHCAAPLLIQSATTAISDASRGCPGGILTASSVEVSRSMSMLLSASPGVT